MRAALALLVLCGSALPAGALEMPPDGFEILSPQPHSELRAGGSLTLEWRAGPAAGTFEEWEAFLSLDGGATWPYRLTPHLDRALNRVEVELPAVASPRARLLFRFGDERRERELLFPFELAVAPPDRAAPSLAAARWTDRAAEPARPGLGGVSEWVEGARDGSRLVRYERRFGSGLAPRAQPGDDLPEAVATAQRAPDVAPAAAGGGDRHRDLPASDLDSSLPLLPPGAAARLARLRRRNT